MASWLTEQLVTRAEAERAYGELEGACAKLIYDTATGETVASQCWLNALVRGAGQSYEGWFYRATDYQKGHFLGYEDGMTELAFARTFIFGANNELGENIAAKAREESAAEASKLKDAAEKSSAKDTARRGFTCPEAHAAAEYNTPRPGFECDVCAPNIPPQHAHRTDATEP